MDSDKILSPGTRVLPRAELSARFAGIAERKRKQKEAQARVLRDYARERSLRAIRQERRHGRR